MPVLRLRNHTSKNDVRGRRVDHIRRVLALPSANAERFSASRLGKMECEGLRPRAVAHMKQVEWENQQLLKQMEETKRIYKIDLAAVKREDKVAAAKYYEEELRIAQQRATTMEEALTTVKQAMEGDV
jgi:hypothetical protein